VIAIDGPAASGKSSVAQKLARRLGFVYVNSGAIYRAITWHLLQNSIQPEESGRIGEALDSAALACIVDDGEARIVVDDVNPAEHLRDDRVNKSVSRVSRLPRVREIVSHRLHDCARGHDVVIEGRDIGSVKNLMIDPKQGKINSVSMAIGGFIGMGEKTVLVPWDGVTVAREGQRLVVTVPNSVLEQAPSASPRLPGTPQNPPPPAR